jgi:hypothetical protein
MTVRIEGIFDTEIYATDDGYVAIEQAQDVIVLLSADVLPPVISVLQRYYDDRSKWQEAVLE